MKFILPLFLISTIMVNGQENNCNVHNDNFEIFVKCLNENDNNYNVCKNFFEEIDWEEWVSNDCYYVLKLPR